MLTSAPLPSKMQNIASQHSGPLAERARGRKRRREANDGKKMQRETERVEIEFNLISYRAWPGRAMVSSIIHDTHPRSECGRKAPLVSLHPHMYKY